VVNQTNTSDSKHPAPPNAVNNNNNNNNIANDFLSDYTITVRELFQLFKVRYGLFIV